MCHSESHGLSKDVSVYLQYNTNEQTENKTEDREQMQNKTVPEMSWESFSCKRMKNPPDA